MGLLTEIEEVAYARKLTPYQRLDIRRYNNRLVKFHEGRETPFPIGAIVKSKVHNGMCMVHSFEGNGIFLSKDFGNAIQATSWCQIVNYELVT